MKRRNEFIKLRRSSGLTWDEFAAKAGVCRQTLFNIMIGKKVRQVTINKFRKAFRLTESEVQRIFDV